MEGHYKHIHKTPFDEKNNSGDDNDDDIKQIRPYDRLASRLGCDYCFFVTDYRQELDDHLNQKHPESRIDPRLIYTSKKVQDSRVTIKLEGISITPVHQTPKSYLTANDHQMVADTMFVSRSGQKTAKPILNRVAKTQGKRNASNIQEIDSNGHMEDVESASPPKLNKSNDNQIEGKAGNTNVTSSASIDSILEQNLESTLSTSVSLQDGRFSFRDEQTVTDAILLEQASLEFDKNQGPKAPSISAEGEPMMPSGDAQEDKCEGKSLDVNNGRENETETGEKRLDGDGDKKSTTNHDEAKDSSAHCNDAIQISHVVDEVIEVVATTEETKGRCSKGQLDAIQISSEMTPEVTEVIEVAASPEAVTAETVIEMGNDLDKEILDFKDMENGAKDDSGNDLK